MRISMPNIRIPRLRRRSPHTASASYSTDADNKVLNVDTINPKIVQAEYAVRGEIVLKALEYEARMAKGEKFPFEKTIQCNIGNPQSLGQKPITFPRQILSLINYPELLNMKEVAATYPSDIVERAKKLIANIPGGTGAYSHSKGVAFIRNEVAEFLHRRDGYQVSPENIFLTDGASQGVQSIIRALIRHKYDGIMVPIPQYPLYSASITMNGGTMCGYYLDENKDWGMTEEELYRSLHGARSKGVNVRAIVIINPGNPTGQCLDVNTMQMIIEFCKKEHLLLMADEVYQENIWQSGRKFTSFKKVLCDMGSAYEDVELVSFHSVSKGFFGECGRRGGYMELTHINQGAADQLYKLASVSLCSNVEGQVMVSCMVNPPQKGDESFELYENEKNEILSSLRRRATKLVKAYNAMEGVTCRDAQGALYTFPQITLPEKAVQEAQALGKAPDAFYCLKLLEATGIVVVPGSGFEQEPGTYHFRSTILPPEEAIDDVCERHGAFHSEFMRKYS